MKRHFGLVVVCTVVTASIALSANASPIVLIDEDFNNPQDGATNGTDLVGDTTNFPDWNFNDGAGFQPGYRVGPQDGAPVSAGDGFIKMDTFSGSGNTYTVQYDTGHNWSAGDQFTLSLNATEQAWGSGNDRFMVVSLKETARTGNNLTGTTVWTVTQELILDPDHDGAGEGWGPNNTFSWTFDTDDFLAGTEGTALSFEIAGAGSRGYHFDNVFLSVTEIPEPASLALVGLGSLLIAGRRRRA